MGYNSIVYVWVFLCPWAEFDIGKWFTGDEI